MPTTSPVLAMNVEPNPQDAVWARFVAPFLAGEATRVRQVECPTEGVRPIDLVPLGSVVSTWEADSRSTLLAETTYATILIQSWAGSRHAYLRATDFEAIEKAEADLRSRFPTRVDDDTVEVDFWQVNRGAFTSSRAIVAPGPEVERNYPPAVWEQFVELRDGDLELDGGRIVLWHGPPGTGKTTAIRALARSWKGHVRTQIVLDPEAVFGSSSLLMQLLMDESDGEPWRLLVVEDADELIRADAKDRVGQALSRLLNLSDGILGQGVRVAVLITTNEPVARLHPALVRPGRCLAETEFRRFTRAEAETRGPTDLPDGASFSLAELSALERGEAADVADPAVSTGMYL